MFDVSIQKQILYTYFDAWQDIFVMPRYVDGEVTMPRDDLTDHMSAFSGNRLINWFKIECIL